MGASITRRIGDVERVVELIRRAEASLGYKCSDGNRCDLIADNFNEWPLDYIRHVYADAKPILNGDGEVE